MIAVAGSTQQQRARFTDAHLPPIFSQFTPAIAKVPFLPQWQERLFDRDLMVKAVNNNCRVWDGRKFHRFDGITGIIPAGYVVLDCDGPNVFSAYVWKELAKGDSTTLRTLAWGSGPKSTGRFKIAYRLPEGFEVPSRKLVKKISTDQKLELLFSGHPVTLPPSKHPTHGKYQYHCPQGANQPILDAPGWLLELIGKLTQQKRDRFATANLKAVDGISNLEAVAVTDGDVWKLLDRISSEDYDEWLQVGMCLHSLGDEYLDAWEEWSFRSDKYKAGECEKKWRTFTERLGAWGRLCRMAGIKPPDADEELAPEDRKPGQTWKEQRDEAAKKAWARSRLFTHNQEIDQQFVHIDGGLGTGIHALKSGMGTGKTQELARLLKQSDRGVVAIGSRNSLLLQSCERWGGFYHLHNDSAFGLTRDPYSRIACCIDSLPHFHDSDFDGKIIILDEVLSVVKHGLLSNTLSDKRSACLAKLEQAIKRASVVVAWDGNNADIAINYLAALRGPDCKIIKQLNRFKGDRLSVELVRAVGINEKGEAKLRLGDSSPVVAKIKEALAAGGALPNGNIVIISDSQRQCEALDGILSGDGYRVLRVDSKTTSDKAIKQFLTDPNAYIEQNKPQVLIMSPTAESGIDISIKGYFGKGFAFFFGIIDTATQMQFLRRVRDCLDWSVWCKEYTTLEDWEGTRSPFARQLQKELIEALEIDAVKALEGTAYESAVDALMERYKQQINTPHTQAALQFIAARNYERTHTRECLQQSLEDDGHTVKLVNFDPDEGIAKELGQEKESINRAEASAIFHAPDITLDEAWAIKSKFSASLEDRYAAEKALLKARLPGIEFQQIPTEDGYEDVWCPEFIYKIKFEDRALLPQLERYWMLTHMDAAKERAKQQWESIIQYGAMPTDIKCEFSRLKALEALGIADLVGGEYTEDSPEIQRIYNGCKRSKRIQTALRMAPGKLKPLDFVGRLTKSVGIVRQSKRSPRDANGDRRRIYTYIAPDASEMNQAILACIAENFQKYLFSETAETVAPTASEVGHLTPKEIPILAEVAHSDPWLTPESLADIREQWQIAQSDPEMLTILHETCPAYVLEQAIA